MPFVSQEKTRPSTGEPDTAAFLEPPALTLFSKTPDLVDLLERELKNIRSKFLPILDRSLAPPQSRLEVATLADLLIRSAFSKTFPANFKVKGGAGKFDVDKINIIERAWANVIDEKYPLLGFSAEAALAPPDLEKTEEDKMLDEKVESKHLGVQPPEDLRADTSEVYVGV